MGDVRQEHYDSRGRLPLYFRFRTIGNANVILLAAELGSPFISREIVNKMWNIGWDYACVSLQDAKQVLQKDCI
jgi:hypothetical protein